MILNRLRKEAAIRDNQAFKLAKVLAIKEYYHKGIQVYASNGCFLGLGLVKIRLEGEIAKDVARALRYRGVKLLLHKGTNYWKIVFDTERYFGSEPSREVS